MRTHVANARTRTRTHRHTQTRVFKNLVYIFSTITVSSFLRFFSLFWVILWFTAYPQRPFNLLKKKRGEKKSYNNNILAFNFYCSHSPFFNKLTWLWFAHLQSFHQTMTPDEDDNGNQRTMVDRRSRRQRDVFAGVSSKKSTKRCWC